jgi:hypothetical protein
MCSKVVDLSRLNNQQIWWDLCGLRIAHCQWTLKIHNSSKISSKTFWDCPWLLHIYLRVLMDFNLAPRSAR